MIGKLTDDSKSWWWDIVSSPLLDLIALIVGVGIEIFLRKQYDVSYVGVGLFVAVILIKLGYLYRSWRQTSEELQTSVNQALENIRLLSCPYIAIKYLNDLYTTLTSGSGLELNTKSILHMASVFLLHERQGFLATWTPNLDLAEMSPDYVQQQQAANCKSKRRIVVVSKHVAHEQLVVSRAKVQEFVQWHKESRIELYWLDPDIIRQRLMASGLSISRVDDVISHYRDFIFFASDKLGVFYDVGNRLMEGTKPPDEIAYRTRIVLNDAPQVRTPGSNPDVHLMVSYIQSSPEKNGDAKRIRTIDELERCVSA